MPLKYPTTYPLLHLLAYNTNLYGRNITALSKAITDLLLVNVKQKTTIYCPLSPSPAKAHKFSLTHITVA